MWNLDIINQRSWSGVDSVVGAKTFTPENYSISGRFCPTQENVGSHIRLALFLYTNQRRCNTAEELNDRITTFPDPLLLENS
jgi:hypothetical protein